jgi:hypothetical protein
MPVSLAHRRQGVDNMARTSLLLGCSGKEIALRKTRKDGGGPRPVAELVPSLPASNASHAFDAPQEADWHRQISVAAYYRAMKPEHAGQGDLEHWLAAEQEIRASMRS